MWTGELPVENHQPYIFDILVSSNIWVRNPLLFKFFPHSGQGAESLVKVNSTHASQSAWPHTFIINFKEGLRYFVMRHRGHDNSSIPKTNIQYNADYRNEIEQTKVQTFKAYLNLTYEIISMKFFKKIKQKELKKSVAKYVLSYYHKLFGYAHN